MDIWGILEYTASATVVALLIWLVKLIFHDKLDARWHYFIWLVLLVRLVMPVQVRAIPAPLSIFQEIPVGRWVEMGKIIAQKKGYQGLTEQLFRIYLLGAAGLGGFYLILWTILRIQVALAPSADEDTRRYVDGIAAKYGLRSCRDIRFRKGTPCICGLLRPVLVIPPGERTEEAVILHELLHKRYKDVLVNIGLHAVRVVNWFNPLIWLVTSIVQNDSEALCDQRVLERLEGEERRDYGRILLSMAGEKYARAPGTSSASNGGENVRRRIEAIARFKRYPAGMALASVCVTVALAVPLVVGVRAEGVPEWRGTTAFTMSAARAVRCSTPAGAIDAYAKGILTGEFPYLAMCAPLDRQDALAAACDNNSHSSRTGTDWMMEQSGLPCWPSRWAGYRVFNLEQLADGSCEGLLVVQLNYPPDGQPQGEEAYWVAVQPIRAEKEGDRWVALPLGYFQAVPDVEGRTFGSFPMSEAVPARVYEAQAGDFTVRAECWTAGTLSGQPGESVDLVPHPHGAFGQFYVTQSIDAVYTGDPADKDEYQKIAVTSAPCRENGQRPALRDPRSDTYATGSSNSGASWGSQRLRTDWYDEILMLSGGGTTFDWERDGDHLPDRVAADLYLNDKLTAELTLLPVEGGGTTPTWSAAPELSLGRLPVEGGGARD